MKIEMDAIPPCGLIFFLETDHTHPNQSETSKKIILESQNTKANKKYSK